MKKIFCLLLTLYLVTLCGCGADQASSPDPSVSDAPNTEANTSSTPPEVSDPETSSEDQPAQSEAPISTGTGPVDLNFASEVTALEGSWVLTQVFA